MGSTLHNMSFQRSPTFKFKLIFPTGLMRFSGRFGPFPSGVNSKHWHWQNKHFWQTSEWNAFLHSPNALFHSLKDTTKPLSFQHGSSSRWCGNAVLAMEEVRMGSLAGWPLSAAEGSASCWVFLVSDLYNHFFLFTDAHVHLCGLKCPCTL